MRKTFTSVESYAKAVDKAFEKHGHATLPPDSPLLGFPGLWHHINGVDYVMVPPGETVESMTAEVVERLEAKARISNG